MGVRVPLFTVLPLLLLAVSTAGAETVVEAGRGGGFHHPYSVSVNPTDGSCWVADSNHGQAVHLGVLGDVFADVNRYHWASEAIDACAAQNIVAGYPDGLYHPEQAVTRDQMAVYIARAFDLRM